MLTITGNSIDSQSFLASIEAVCERKGYIVD